MRRLLLAGLVASLALAGIAAPVGAKSGTPDGPPDSTAEFGAGDVCNFPIRLEAWSNETVRNLVDRYGRDVTVVTGGAQNRVTRLDPTGGSILVRNGGLVVISDPGDGTSRLNAIGWTLLYFFPGDKNPAGEGNGLFLVIGTVDQSLDLATNVVTRFKYRGSYQDICAALS